MGMSEWDNGLKSDIFFVQAWYQMFGGHGGLLKEFVYVGIGLLDYKEDRILAKTIWYKIQFGLFRSYCKIKLALGSSSILRVMKRRVGVFILLEESFKIMIWSWYLSGPNIEYCLEGVWLKVLMYKIHNYICWESFICMMQFFFFYCLQRILDVEEFH